MFRNKLVYVPAGFGHAFIALEDNTIQAFALDTKAPYENSRSINYMSPGIELKLPVDNVLMADYDRNDLEHCKRNLQEKGI